MQQGVKSVEVAGRVLRALIDKQTKVSLKELSNAVSLSPAKLHRYLVSLMQFDLVAQDPETRQYQLGPFALELGISAMNSSKSLDEAIRKQRQLRDELDETVTLSIWSPEGPVIAHVAEGRQTGVMTVRTGTYLPLLGTASGIIFASFLPRPVIAPLLKSELEQTETANPIAASEKELGQLAASVRERKVVVNHGHLLSGVTAIATPLLGSAGDLFAVLAVVVGRNLKLAPERENQIIERLLMIGGHAPTD